MSSHLLPETGDPIWVVTGNYLDKLAELLVCGDSLLVVFDAALVRAYGLQ